MIQIYFSVSQADGILLLHCHRRSVSDRNDRSQQAICMLKHIQIFPHPLVDRAVSALHRVMRLNDVPVLQHIV